MIFKHIYRNMNVLCIHSKQSLNPSCYNEETKVLLTCFLSQNMDTHYLYLCKDLQLITKETPTLHVDPFSSSFCMGFFCRLGLRLIITVIAHSFDFIVFNIWFIVFTMKCQKMWKAPWQSPELRPQSLRCCFVGVTKNAQKTPKDV